MVQKLSRTASARTAARYTRVSGARFGHLTGIFCHLTLPISVDRHLDGTMSFVLQPWQLLLVILAGWVNRQQQAVIEYLHTENRVLREKLGKRRILLNDDQRRRLAVKGKVLGRKVLAEIGTLVTPDTILRWHRLLVARKWNYADRRKQVGRPRVAQAVVALVLRMARGSPSWGYDRILGALANLGHRIAPSTVANILKGQGIEPAPERKRRSTWRTFLKAHWECLGAIDFTTIEVWTKRGLVTYYLLFVMRVASRRVHFAGCTVNPTADWMKADRPESDGSVRRVSSPGPLSADGPRQQVLSRVPEDAEGGGGQLLEVATALAQSDAPY
jgi:hypothetical protein